MKTIYFCAKCRSTNLNRDANVGINTEEVSTYDNVSCSDCGYDGSHYRKLELIDAEAAKALDEADDADDNKLPESWGDGEECFL